MEKILFIHVDSKPDTSVFSHLYKDIKGANCKILYNPRKSEVRHELHDFTYTKIIIIGHGDINGLYDKDWKGYVIDSSLVQLLREHNNVIGIWCHATEFARRYGLHGFYTSMFISNADEATECGFSGCSEQDIEKNAIIFCERIKNLINVGFPTDVWYDYFIEQPENKEPYVKYNYEAIEFFE